MTADLGHYLGIPLLHGKVTRRVYYGIVEKVKARVSGSATSSLSMAGRTTLINSVFTSNPVFTMQSTRIPRSILDKVERLCRGFLWGHTESRRKIHLVSWNVVTQPTDRGGLGIKRLVEFNHACLAKLCWGILNNKDQL